MSDDAQRRVLIVDDEMPNINFYKVALSRLPLSIDTATSGGEAFELIKQNQYDLVILDLLMPGVTGIGLLQKAEREGVDLPIVLVCSSVTDKSVISQALMLGAGGYITKPVGYQQLVHTVCDYLNLPVPQHVNPVAAPMKPFPQSAPRAEFDRASHDEPATPSRASSAKSSAMQTGRYESLSRAMSAMVFHKQTGTIDVHTPNGIGKLEYEKGRLQSVSYLGKTSIDALEVLRGAPHRLVHVDVKT